jgi:dTDP-4-dehydrorhamnose reductase
MAAPRILVTGTAGQLALALAERAPDRVRLVGRPELDLADDASIARAVAAHAPDVIVNAAAYTAVDKAEAEPELAARINAHAPGVLARAARAAGARLVQISTDYVFDGSESGAYSEDAPTGPAGVYGRTKLAGEDAVRAELPGAHAVVRTAWVYSPFGANFVKTMLAAARSRPELRVVADQHGNPTSALHLADGILALIACWRERPEADAFGTFHLAGSGAAVWAELAREVFAVSARLGGPAAEVVPIATSDWPTPARRPANSRLDSARFAATFGYRAPHWREGVAETVARLLQAAAPTSSP